MRLRNHKSPCERWYSRRNIKMYGLSNGWKRPQANWVDMENWKDSIKLELSADMTDQ